MSCAEQPEEGIWTPLEPSRSITKLQIRLNCQDQVLNGQPYPPGPPWYVHLWGACEPSDCDWGEAGAVRLFTGQLYATYDQGFAQRHLFLQLIGAELWMFLSTHFTDPNRGDYTVQSWFHRTGVARRLAAEELRAEIPAKRHVSKGHLASSNLLDQNPQGAHVQLVTRDVRAPLPKALARSI